MRLAKSHDLNIGGQTCHFTILVFLKGKDKNKLKKGGRLLNLLKTNRLGASVTKISNAVHRRKEKSKII